jgi:hypothetical protein
MEDLTDPRVPTLTVAPHHTLRVMYAIYYPDANKSGM